MFATATARRDSQTNGGRPSDEPSPEGLIRAAQRFRIIKPVIFGDPRRSKPELIAAAAKRSNTGKRTVYHWLRAYRRGGILGLVPKRRDDLGRPRSINSDAASRFIEVACSIRHPRITVAEAYRAYCEERAWRMAHSQMEMGPFERVKYAGLLNGNLLSPTALLPPVSFECFRQWFRAHQRALRSKIYGVSKKPQPIRKREELDETKEVPRVVRTNPAEQ